MTEHRSREGISESGDREYGELLFLEELESLLEDLEEAGITDILDAADLPAELLQRVQAAGVATLDELKARILELHDLLDEREYPT